MPLLVVFERKAGLEPVGADAPTRGYIYIPPKSPFKRGTSRVTGSPIHITNRRQQGGAKCLSLLSSSGKRDSNP